jgi:hypothetical protein
MYGISLFTAIIGAIIGSMITRAPLISAEARRKIAQMEQPEDTDGDGEIGLNDYFFFLRVRFLELIGWEEYNLNYLVTAAALTWVVLGVLYGVYIEGWDVNHSIYFAMNAVSMAALADPPCEDGDSSHCDVGFYRGLAMSLYLIIGVPLFTLMLAQLAGLFINRAVRENEYKIIHQPLTQEEYNYAANLYDNDEVLSLGEFTVLELLRLQRVSMEDLEHIKNLFCAIDEAATGMVDQPMLAKRNLIQHYGAVSPAGLAAGTDSQGRGGARQRDRAGSGDSLRNLSSRRTRSRSRSFGSASMGPGGRRRDTDHSPAPLVKIPSVIFDEGEGEVGEGAEGTSHDLQSSGGGGGDGGDGDGGGVEGGEWEEGGDGSEDAGSSLAAPEVPASIKRMTMQEYNQLVVPLAFTTLIENYDEGGAEEDVDSLEDDHSRDRDRDREEDDEVSSRGFNTAAEEELTDDWPSDTGYRYGRDTPAPMLGTIGRTGSGGVGRRGRYSSSRGPAGLRSRLQTIDSEREDDDDDAEPPAPALLAQRLRSKSRPALRERPSRGRASSRTSRSTPARRKLGFSAREGKDPPNSAREGLSDMEKGYKSET